MNIKLKYLIYSILRYLTKIECPFCQSFNCEITDRKYLFTRLIECANCHLLFRHPLDKDTFNERFYQDEYQQTGGFTTDLPTAYEANLLRENNFANTDKYIGAFLEIFKSLFREGIHNKRIVDYGASWGYMSYQFQKFNMNVQAFEISKRRAKFGSENLDLEIHTDLKNLEDDNDIFFSSHVIEHLTDLNSFFKEAKTLLNEDGYFIAECPNGSLEFRKIKLKNFHHNWGLVHPYYITADFYKYIFLNNPYLILSAPYNIKLIEEWDKKSQVICNLEGNNLLVICKLNSIQ